jgi:hypothetical integral membrane protein (TIGR02206 family)
MTRRPFVLFGPDHLVALGATLAVALLLVVAIRRDASRRAWRTVGPAFAALIAGAIAVYVALLARAGTLDLRDVLPVHLCDLLLLIAIVALFTRRPLPSELLYFWGGAGTLMALLTPDVRWAWPHERFVIFFGFHAVVVVAAAVVTFGYGVAPRPGAVWRVFLFTNVYALAVFALNRAWGTNYLFLSRKPRGATLLDYFGPWPWYILVADVVALGLFLLLEAPWRLRGLKGRRAGTPRARGASAR